MRVLAIALLPPLARHDEDLRVHVAQLFAAGGEVADLLLAGAVLAGWYAAGGRELARAARRATVNAS